MIIQIFLDGTDSPRSSLSPSAKNAEQAGQNAGALGWKLTEEQVKALDGVSDEVVK